MTTQLLTIKKAARLLKQQAVIAYPTEAVYGLGCLPQSRSAVLEILALKQRPISKGLVVVAASFDQLRAYIDIDAKVNIDWLRIKQSWPGPVTWVVPAMASVPEWITGGGGSIAVRVSANQTIRHLCTQVGPIVSTSANPSRKLPARSALAVKRYFGSELYCVSGALSGFAKPTEIRDGLTQAILRQA